jgi:hypothetical protein
MLPNVIDCLVDYVTNCLINQDLCICFHYIAFPKRQSLDEDVSDKRVSPINIAYTQSTILRTECN